MTWRVMVEKSGQRILILTVHACHPRFSKAIAHPFGKLEQGLAQDIGVAYVPGKGRFLTDGFYGVRRDHRTIIDAAGVPRHLQAHSFRRRKPDRLSDDCARSPIVLIPSGSRRAAVFCPTPHRAVTGNGARNAASSPLGTTVIAFGGTPRGPVDLTASLAIFATSLLAASPVNTGDCKRLLISDCRLRAIASPGIRQIRDIDEGFIDGDLLHQRAALRYARHHFGWRPGSKDRGVRGSRPSSDTAARPGSSALQSERQSCGRGRNRRRRRRVDRDDHQRQKACL